MLPGNFTALTDHQLFELIKQGNEGAFDELFNRRWEEIYTTVAAILANQEAAQDIVQDLFIKVWTNREEIENTNITGFLFKIAKLESYQYLRKNKIRQQLLDQFNNLTFAHDTEDKINFSEVKKYYRESLKTMPEKTRIIFKLSRIENLSNQEISKKLDISVKTVEYHMSNALKHLRQHLADLMSILILMQHL